MNINLPDGWHIYPLAEVTIGIFAILIAMLIVQIMTLRVLKSFQTPKEPRTNKQKIDNLTFRDMR